MTPDRPSPENDRRRATLEALLSLSQVAVGYGQEIELMIAQNKDHPNLPAGAESQTGQIKDRLADLGKLLADLSARPGLFSLIGARVLVEEEMMAGYDLVFRRGSAASMPTLYFKTTLGGVARIYAAPLYDEKSRDPFGDPVAVPEIGEESFISPIAGQTQWALKKSTH